MTKPAGEPLDVAAVFAELGAIHTQLAARGHLGICEELAQLRVLVRQQQDEIEKWQAQVPPSATGPATT